MSQMTGKFHSLCIIYHVLSIQAFDSQRKYTNHVLSNQVLSNFKLEWIVFTIFSWDKYMDNTGLSGYGSGLGATNAEIFSNQRFLRNFEFFSPNCATKHSFPQTQSDLRVFSQIWDFSQMFVRPTFFQPHLRNKSWDFSENVQTGN